MAALREEAPSVLLGAELGRLDTTSYQRGPGRRRVGSLQRWDARERARRLAEVRAALSKQTDPVTRRRLDVVALRLGGLSSKAASDGLGVGIGFVYTVYSEYRLGGIGGLLGACATGVVRRAPRTKPALFSDDAKDGLRTIVERERAAGSELTYKALAVLCAGELGVTCEKQTLRKTLLGMGIDLVSSRVPRAKRAVEVPDATPGPVPSPRPVPTPPTTDRRRRGREPHAVRYGVA